MAITDQEFRRGRAVIRGLVLNIRELDEFGVKLGGSRQMSLHKRLTGSYGLCDSGLSLEGRFARRIVSATDSFCPTVAEEIADDGWFTQSPDAGVEP